MCVKYRAGIRIRPALLNIVRVKAEETANATGIVYLFSSQIKIVYNKTLHLH